MHGLDQPKLQVIMPVGRSPDPELIVLKVALNQLPHLTILNVHHASQTRMGPCYPLPHSILYQVYTQVACGRTSFGH